MPVLDNAGRQRARSRRLTAIEESICRVASDVLDVPMDSLTRDSSPATVETWDSVAHLSLVLAVEEELGITFDVYELDQLTTVGALADTAERYLNSA
jgi:acyl carrier protein